VSPPTLSFGVVVGGIGGGGEDDDDDGGGAAAEGSAAKLRARRTDRATHRVAP
jgi:hypothetical protein